MGSEVFVEQLVLFPGVSTGVTRHIGLTIGKPALVLLFAAALVVAAKAATVTMPYRVLETEYYPWMRMFYGALAVAGVCVATWIKVASTRLEKTAGLFAGFALVSLFVAGGPSGPRSIISVKNICINQLRQIDGAKEEWARRELKSGGEEVDVRGLTEFLKEKRIPGCPKGGAYSIGKVGDAPRCSIGEHNMER